MKWDLFRHDNAPTHKILFSIAVMRDCGFEILDHAPYSPDLTTSDYHLFPNMGKIFAGNQYRSVNDVIYSVYNIFDQQNESIFASWIRSPPTLMEVVCLPHTGLC